MLSNSFSGTKLRIGIQLARFLNAAYLSDEAGKGERKTFTGNLVGMITFEKSGLAAEEKFFHFSYPDAQ